MTGIHGTIQAPSLYRSQLSLSLGGSLPLSENCQYIYKAAKDLHPYSPTLTNSHKHILLDVFWGDTLRRVPASNRSLDRYNDFNIAASNNLSKALSGSL